MYNCYRYLLYYNSLVYSRRSHVKTIVISSIDDLYVRYLSYRVMPIIYEISFASVNPNLHILNNIVNAFS